LTQKIILLPAAVVPEEQIWNASFA